MILDQEIAMPLTETSSPSLSSTEVSEEKQIDTGIEDLDKRIREALVSSKSGHVSKALVERVKEVQAAQKMRLEVITPQQAAIWLSKSQNYRTLKLGNVRYLTDSFDNDDYVVDGSTIKINPEGGAVDGQHRLAACVLSGKPFLTWVCYGVDDVRYVDTGVGRKVSDWLRSIGEVQVEALGAALRMLWHHYHGAGLNTDDKHRLGPSLLAPVLEKHGKIRESIKTAYVSKRFVSVAQGGVLHYLFSRKNGELSDTFVQRLGDGLELGARDPVRRLREELITDGTRQGPRKFSSGIVRMAHLILAWNAWRANHVGFRVWKESDPFPEVK
jgi:hypothetical protein